MIDLIKRIIGDTSSQIKKVEQGSIDDIQVALCVLLLEAAYADGDCSSEEMENLKTTLTTRFDVAKEDIEALLASGYKERDEAIDLFRFTRYLNNNYNKEEKISVMESVWQVIHSDGRLEGHEDHFAHKLANLLRLTHKEMIDAKIKARQDLK